MKDELQKIGIETVENIKKEFDLKKLNDRGGAKSSISYTATDHKLSIEGLKRVLFLNQGRRPKQGYNSESWRELIPFILPWVRRKLNVPEEAVFPVARQISDKIQREGTRILKDRAKGLELEIIFSEMLEEISKKIIDAALIKTSSDILKAFD